MLTENMEEIYFPGADEFKSIAKLEFSFLLTDFGFEEYRTSRDTNHPYSITFKENDTFIHIDKIGYGSLTGVFIGRFDQSLEIKNSFPLEDVISFRNSKLLESINLEKTNQILDLNISAMALRSCADDFLKGDFSDLPGLERHIQELDINDKARYVKLMVRKATEAHHSGNYRKVVEILQPFRDDVGMGSAGWSLLVNSQKRLDSDKLKSCVKLEFSFLLTEFGFEESKLPEGRDLYSILFKKDSAYVFVYGFGDDMPSGVSFGMLDHSLKIKKEFSLENVISFRKPELHKPGHPAKTSQHIDLKFSAMALRSCAGDFLSGDFSNLPKLERHILKTGAEKGNEKL